MKLKDALANISAKERNDRVVRQCGEVIEYIRHHPTTTRQQIAEACGLDKKTLSNRITLLKSRGMLRIERKYVISGKLEE